MTLSRRTMIAAPAVLAAAPALGQAAASSPSSAPGGQVPGYYRFKIGEIEVIPVHDGSSPRPLEGLVRNAEIEAVRAAARNAFMPTDAFQNTYTPLVVRTGGRTVLIDTGFGDSGPANTGLLRTNLRAAGIDPASINTVVISHFHGDHINGLRLKDGTATFPNAEVMVPEAEWAFWMDDARASQAPEAMRGAFQTARRVFGPMKDVARFGWGKEVAPGVTAVDASGHSPGHTAFAISSGGQTLTHVVDTTNHPRIFARNPDWALIFDMDPDKARATRRRMLDMAASERSQLSFYHAPFPATGHVRKEGDGYEFVPIQFMPTM